MTTPDPQPAQATDPLSWDSIVQPGVRALKSNWRPFVLIQVVAAACVVAYYNFGAVRDAFDWLGTIKMTYGYVASGIAASFAGALLPELAKALSQPGYRLRGRGEELTYLLIFFFFNGIVVDAFYRTLGMIVGTGSDFGTAFIKMLVDMLVFTPLLVLPLVMLGFAWRRHSYKVKPVAQELARHGIGGWYARRVAPVLLPDWAFWAPMVLLIYSMPPSLQVILFALALAAWSLVMVFIGNEELPPEAQAEPGVLAVTED